MPNQASSPLFVSPSTKGSAPVQDILQGIRVRDPQRAYTGGYHRRMEDLETHWRLSQEATVGLIIVVITGSLFLLPQHNLVRGPNLRPSIARTIRSVPQAEAPLSVPRGLHPWPQSLSPLLPPLDISAGVPRPENLHAHFLGPRTLEVSWNSLGDGYRYLLYSAPTSSLENAQPVLEKSVPSTTALWIPEDDVDSTWMAVKGIDADGHATPFSRPVLVQMPPA